MSETVHTLTKRQLEVIHILDDSDILIRPPTLDAPQRWHIGLHLIAAQTIEKLTQKGLVHKTDDEFHALQLTVTGKAIAKETPVQSHGGLLKIKTGKNLLKKLDSNLKSSAKIERKVNATGL